MKRCDLHIHTVPSVSDRMFTYDKATLFIVLPIIPCVTAIDKHFYPLLI